MSADTGGPWTRGERAAAELDEVLAFAVGDVRGRRLLHLDCGNGVESVRLTRRGAFVVGLAGSEDDLRRAKETADRALADVEFTVADAREVPESRRRAFDVAYAAVGVLRHVPRTGAWMRSVADALVSGGSLVLVDVHPARMAVGDPDVPVLDFPYAGTGARVNDEYPHSVGEVVTAAVEAGLRVRRLVEHLSWPYDPVGSLPPPPRDNGTFELRVGGGVLPTMFSLVADR
ncbi:MAG: methyltransferase domain-containing protein [Streptosporangiales bacterium]|nr:methyltransferase domain-containing protein [Streptosporangiales bacterium]